MLDGKTDAWIDRQMLPNPYAPYCLWWGATLRNYLFSHNLSCSTLNIFFCKIEMGQKISKQICHHVTMLSWLNETRETVFLVVPLVGWSPSRARTCVWVERHNNSGISVKNKSNCLHRLTY